jgi:hypothetical protein
MYIMYLVKDQGMCLTVDCTILFNLRFLSNDAHKVKKKSNNYSGFGLIGGVV